MHQPTLGYLPLFTEVPCVVDNIHYVSAALRASSNIINTHTHTQTQFAKAQHKAFLAE